MMSFVILFVMFWEPTCILKGKDMPKLLFGGESNLGLVSASGTFSSGTFFM